MNNKTVVAVLLAVLAGESKSENVTLTTYFPAPSGAYAKIMATQDAYLATTVSGRVGVGVSNPTHKLTVNGDMKVDAVDFVSFGTNPPLKTGETMPAPGRLFYRNGASGEGFYYSSKDADPVDSSTWYKPMSGLQETIVVNAALATFSQTADKAQWIKTWNPSAGVVSGSNDQKVRSAHEMKSAGLYTLTVSGTYCTDKATPPTDADPAITLYYWRFKCNMPACNNVTWWSDATITSSGANIQLDADGCGTFSIESLVMIPANKGVAVGAKFKHDEAGAGAYSLQKLSTLQISATRIMGF